MADICNGQLILGKGMNEGVVPKGVTPDSDCNSNHPNSASFLSVSSQDVDFVQDNSDYQWFLDYGYRDGGTNHHTSLLSLPESYEAGDLNYYDAFSKNMDANLAEADMESFRTEDIHALLTNLPPMCTDHLSQENHRQGECYASVSGSMMAKFDFDSSISPHSSSQGEDSTSMSICKSELLFSPVREVPVPGANYSVDSLDCDFQDMMLTCQANKDNYTIAFEGSLTMYSEESEFNGTEKSDEHSNSAHFSNDLKAQAKNIKKLSNALPMTQSDSGSFTTWSKLKKAGGDNQVRRHPSGNNNNSGDDATHLGLNDNTAKSQSMPNLYKQKLIKSLMQNNILQNTKNASDVSTLKRKRVKVFDIQHHTQTNSGSGASISDMATSIDASSSENISNTKQPNFSLVKLFMKQKSLSTEGMSTTADQLSSSENWPGTQSVESNCSETKSADHQRYLDHSHENKIGESVTKIHGYIAEEPEDELTKKEDISRLDCSKKSLNNNNSFCDIKRTESPIKKSHLKSTKNDAINRSIQTSNFSEIINLKNVGKAAPPKVQEPVKVVEPSFLNKLKKEGEVEKPVYVIYPNYVLPNLDFLNEKEEDVAKILLMPQRPPPVTTQRKRPFSCNDLETLRAKGFSHVKDWDSLNFLLPPECREILSDIPEVAEYIKRTSSVKQPPPRTSRTKRRPVSCDYTERGFVSNQTNISSSSSTATQPSSGYRGSSTILNDSQNSPAPGNNLNPLFVYRYDSVTSSEASFMQNDRQRSITTAPPLTKRCVSVTHGEIIPPRPPLPKNILSKDPKRFSLCETNTDPPVFEDNKYKRISLQEPYYLARNKRLSETEDEGVDAGTSSSSMDEHEPPVTTRSKSNRLFPNMSIDELTQFEEFLKCSGISSSDPEELSDENMTQLRSYVSRFLSLKMNQEGGEFFGGKKTVSFAEKVNVLPKNLEVKPTFLAPNNSPNVSAFSHQKNYQNAQDGREVDATYSSPQTTPIHRQSYNMVQKWSLVNGVTNAVDLLVKHFSSASNQAELTALGDSSLNPTCAKIALTHLCPALYAVLSDGLKPNLETSFGAINNSVWQVVEASAKQGPLTKALNELVMRINSEDAITEGLVKFNTFVFGLLNVRSLDAWASYLRTRESVLKKHYDYDSLLILSHTGGSNVRVLLDKLITALQPLAVYPFQLDLFYETKQLHMSLKRMETLSPTHKLSFKQWNNAGLSMQSNKSNSDSEEASAATTVRHRSGYQEEENLPDILNSSATTKIKSRSEKERPRSCCDPGSLGKPSFKLGEDVTSIAKKRWSGIALNSKLYQVYDRLAREDDEEYTDSLENTNNMRVEECEDNNSDENIPQIQPESLEYAANEEGKPLNGKRFKKLQQRWEMLSGKDQAFSPPLSPTHTPNTPTPNTPSKSRIPRLITSPVKPVSGIPVAVCQGAKASNGKGSQKKVTTPPNPKPPITNKMGSAKNSPARKTPVTNTRTSRVDQVETGNDNNKHPPRPSSLPYKPAAQNSKSSKVPPRRAASSSLNRKPLSIHSKTPKVVRTLSHRLPSESGHLSYNEGENLKVILRVDDKWLLCCRGTQKGLVPVSAVISADVGTF
ncbi:uncharacterized protein LOC123319421 isoform X3 [Coccinella septempunctata]|uniref:uncharacterized protein LOC123319421 isoform X3 n=1 Tax=Coccinella septempunctata TaxID=41139 RepID=UPI001D06882A|nr:uncharacterized protein LOC123319421 isoform X3 [Coccinella septempunctata]